MSARSRLILDVGMLAALLAAYTPSLTGVAIHEWLSVIVIVPLLFHLVINWEWTVHTATRFFERIRNASRLNLLVDTLLFSSAAAVMLSGLMISRVALPAIGIATAPTAGWIALHAVTADTTIALLLLHFALHFNWAARTLGLLGVKPQAARPVPSAGLLTPATRVATAPARVSTRATNRTLKNTGAVLLATGLTAAAVFAGVSLSATGTAGATATAATGATATTAVAATTSGTTASNSVTTASSSSSTLLVCPATGCTETYCHATTGQRPGH